MALTTGELNENDFRPVVIKKTQAVCVFALSHTLRDEPMINFSMLAGESLLSIDETDELTINIKAQLLKHGLPVEFAVQTTSSITVCALVATGTGVGIVNPCVASAFSKQLLIKPLNPSIGIPVQMFMPIHTAPSLLTRNFIEMLVEKIKCN